ncbi:hypothetical protein MES5069_940012 [Mesorhizobium escarrei]|uniref:Glycoside hydrolase family 3 C-terminal domain-containing protein n=1 Tax=Mesorhizobium escarrei TaxID=666018 RepID=A0ABN8KK63_9HYPH|nr:hypothetical protein MES5069_940012 [Mesorhizobium escarrei]
MNYFPLQGHDADTNAGLAAAAVLAAAGADAVIVFANTDVTYDGEGTDRTDLHLAGGQDALIEQVARVNPRTVVVLASPDAVEMPWLAHVPAVLSTFFAGQGMGGAVAEILFGRRNPSGKLTVTFPARLEDTPAFLLYPGENDRHSYAEGIFVGYRYYDRRRIAPLFPFGFGLSYTTFAYSELDLDRAILCEDDTLMVSFAVTNTGPVTGKEICQVYGGARKAATPQAGARAEGLCKGRTLSGRDEAHRGRHQCARSAIFRPRASAMAIGWRPIQDRCRSFVSRHPPFWRSDVRAGANSGAAAHPRQSAISHSGRPGRLREAACLLPLSARARRQWRRPTHRLLPNVVRRHPQHDRMVRRRDYHRRRGAGGDRQHQ